ncbi:hypothetical protein GTA08_BOTSDO01539 [Botryosphaeria dothidea]|uniref:Uncharacterized protein n=1 Tax=Botryosphaeria dothidea TaxID=55169 RepID=A0A8H4J6M5_9PEZI|nr:hypothetical protein GTA08_BOTSDO01539 [Botryosphaeria dothidea]
MAFLHIWNVRADPYDGHFGLGLPTPGKRIDELFEGIEYHDTDLSWYEWNLITVMEKMSDTHFLVTMNNQCFGCYIPEGAFEYEGYSIFLQEVRSWKRISFARNVPPSISRLSGFVYSRYKPTKLQGVLYEWVEPSHAIPYLSKVQVDEVPIQQRKAWSDQIEHALAFLHERSASFTREGCKGNITERITITTNMEAHLRLIHFGDDYRALAQIRKFLRVDADATCIVNPQTVGFLCIPSEIRNRIYELLLVLPGYVRWHWGYRHQIDVVAGLESDKIAGIGLLGTNRQVRHESLSFLNKNAGLPQFGANSGGLVPPKGYCHHYVDL